MKYLQMLKAINSLVESHKKYINACRKFEQKTGCRALYDDYVHLREIGARELTETLKIDVEEVWHSDEYHRYEFVYQDIKFLWLKRKEER